MGNFGTKIQTLETLFLGMQVVMRHFWVIFKHYYALVSAVAELQSSTDQSRNFSMGGGHKRAMNSCQKFTSA